MAAQSKQYISQHPLQLGTRSNEVVVWRPLVEVMVTAAQSYLKGQDLPPSDPSLLPPAGAAILDPEVEEARWKDGPIWPRQPW